MTLFDEQFEQEAIERIKKFARLAEKMGFVPVVGFSGGKDSQVVYDLCKRSGIKFEAKFNHCFETVETMRFIRKYYPDVTWRREVKQGFFENIRKNHKGYLPTTESAYCCADYKHNPKYVDDASIVGVRRQESQGRMARKTLETKNKTILKRNKTLINEFFSENCVASGAPSEIQLKPIIDWSEEEIWGYIKRHQLPINQEYRERESWVHNMSKGEFIFKLQSVIKISEIDRLRDSCERKKRNKNRLDNHGRQRRLFRPQSRICMSVAEPFVSTILK